MQTFLVFILIFAICEAFNINVLHRSRYNSNSISAFRGSTFSLHGAVKTAPAEDILPYLEEHVQPSDQMLFLGASTDLSIQMVKKGFGTKKTGFMIVVDSNEDFISECKAMAERDPDIAIHLQSGKLKFETVDLTSMKHICKQSAFDSIVDYGALDSLLLNDTSDAGMLKCIDSLQNAVRLGNILVCISQLENEVFCKPFEKRFGWVQELDGIFFSQS